MTTALKKMIQRGHISLIRRKPLRIKVCTPDGAKFVRDTNAIGISGKPGKITEVT